MRVLEWKCSFPVPPRTPAGCNTLQRDAGGPGWWRTAQCHFIPLCFSIDVLAVCLGMLCAARGQAGIGFSSPTASRLPSKAVWLASRPSRKPLAASSVSFSLPPPPPPYPPRLSHSLPLSMLYSSASSSLYGEKSTMVLCGLSMQLFYCSTRIYSSVEGVSISWLFGLFLPNFLVLFLTDRTLWPWTTGLGVELLMNVPSSKGMFVPVESQVFIICASSDANSR